MILSVSTLAAALALAAGAEAAAVPPPGAMGPAAATSAATHRRVEFSPVPAMEAAHVANPHAYQGKPFCQRCHQPGEVRPSRDPVHLCLQCHDGRRMKHPWNVVPARVPAGLPLTLEGKVACHTCHDPHDVKARRAGLRLEYAELCLRCHRKHN